MVEIAANDWGHVGLQKNAQTFQEKNTPHLLHGHHVAVSPADPNRVYLGTQFTVHGWALDVSEDGGQTWSVSGSNTNGLPTKKAVSWFVAEGSIPGPFAICTHPTEKDHLVIGINSDSTVYRSTDGGESFSAVEGDSGSIPEGFFNHSKWALDSNHLLALSGDGTMVAAGGSKTGMRTYDPSNNSWNEVSMFSNMNVTDVQRNASTDGEFVVVATEDSAEATSKLYQSTDGGNTWSEIATNVEFAAYDNNNADNLAVTGGNMAPRLSTDGGSTWEKQMGVPAGVSGRPVFAGGSLVFVTRGNGAFWTWVDSDRSSDSPSTPQNVSAEANGSNSITVSWDASTDDEAMAHYSVFSTSDNSIDSKNVASTSATFTGLEKNTEYSFAVRATDSDLNKSGQSDSATAKTEVGDVEADATLPKASSAPTINAEVGAAWDDGKTFTNNNNVSGTGGNYNSVSFTWQGMWDADNLYIYVSITDSTISVDSDSAPTNDDCLELYLDGDYSHGSQYQNDYQILVRPNRDGYEFGYNSATEADNIEVKSKTTSDGWAAELKVPWTDIRSSKMQADSTIGLDVAVDDDDDGGDRRGQVAWGYEQNQAWSTPEVFSSVTMVDN